MTRRARLSIAGVALSFVCGTSALSAQPTAPPGAAEQVKAEAERLKGQAELLKAQTDQARQLDARSQAAWDFWYKSGVAALVFVIAWRLLPNASELNISVLGNVFGYKRTPETAKLPAMATGPEAMPELVETRDTLKKNLGPGPAAQSVLEPIENRLAYTALGIREDDIYLCHHARPIRGSEDRDLHIYLDAESPEILDKVDRVTYRLHESFINPVRVVTDRAKQFALDARAYGEFMVHATVHFKQGGESIELKRYLNF
jgi:hypothetical protein